MKSLLATSHSPLAKNLILIPAILLLTMCSSDDIERLPDTWDKYVDQFKSSSSGAPTFPFSSSSNPVGNTESSSSNMPSSSSSETTLVSSGSILQSSSTVDGIFYCKFTNGTCQDVSLASVCTTLNGVLVSSCDNGSAVSSSSRLSSLPSSSSLISSSSSAPVVPSSSSSVGTCMGQRNLLAYCPGIAWENVKMNINPYNNSNYMVAECYYIVDAERINLGRGTVNGVSGTLFTNEMYAGTLLPQKVDGGYYIYKPELDFIDVTGTLTGYPDCM